MKKILVPTDFSEEAQNAAELARDIAKKFDAELVFLHAIELTSTETIHVTGELPTYDSFVDALMVKKAIENAQSEMNRLIEVSKFQGINVSQEIKLGSPFTHIYDAVENEGVDFIVMGTKGASGLSEVLIGSNAEKVVRRAKCPVLSVKDKVDESIFDSMVYATIMSEKEDKVVATLKELQQAYGSKVYMVWINTPNNFKPDLITKAQMREFADKHKLQAYEIHVFNDVVEEDGIRHFADEVDAGMIIMGTSSHTGLSRIIRGSVAEDLVNHARRPVLTVSMKY